MLSALTRAFDANEIFSRFLSIHPRQRERDFLPPDI